MQDHVLKVISHLNELEILGAEIDGETQVDIVLMSLPESFNSFRLTYNMSKSHYSLAELLKELQAVEEIIGHKRSLHVMEKRFFLFFQEGSKEEKGSKAGCQVEAQTAAAGKAQGG